MKEPIFRLLNADEIESRVGIVNEKGLSLLLYKDARVDLKSSMRPLAFVDGRGLIRRLMAICFVLSPSGTRKKASG